MSFPFGEHEVYRDDSPEGGGGHLRCLVSNRDHVTFIAMGKRPPPPLRMPRARAEAMTEARTLVRVDSDPFDPPLVPEEPAQGWSDKDRRKHAAQLAHRDRMALVLELLVDLSGEVYLNPYLRDAAVAEAAAKHNLRAEKVNYWARRYYQAGRSASGLFRDYRQCGKGRSPDRPATALLGRPRHNLGETGGRKSGLNVTPEIRSQFMWAANRYMKGERTWKRCFEEMLNRFYRDKVTGPDGKLSFVDRDVPKPTFGQFYAHLQRKFGLSEITRKLVGPTAYEMDHAPRNSTSAGLALGPADHYALDATLVDLYVLSHDRSEVIGRPILYLIIDYYTHMIVGFYLGLENSSWTPASLALANAFENKQEYCRGLGISIEPGQWPSEHGPRGLAVDRGTEMVGDAMKASLFTIKCVHIICPPARPDRKGLVENGMQLIEIDLTNPDARALHPRNMDDTPVPGDATLTLRELEQKFVHWILKYNADLRIGRKQWPAGFTGKGKTSALKLWEWGCVNARAPQRRSYKEVLLALLRPDSVTATREGFHLGRGLFYETDDEELNMLRHRRLGKASVKLPFRRDDRTVDTGFIVYRERLVRARLTYSSKDARGLSMFEFDRRWKEDRKEEAVQEGERRRGEQRLANSLAEIDAGAAKSRLETGPPARNPGGIPEARRAEMSRMHKQDIADRDDLCPAAESPGIPVPATSARRLYPADMMEGDDD